MKVDKKIMLFCLAVPLGAEVLLCILTDGCSSYYLSLEKPPFAPPGWVLPLGFTLLGLSMGFGSYCIIVSDTPGPKRAAIAFYALQLIQSFLWPIVFFRYRMLFTAFFMLCLLWLLVFFTVGLFGAVSRRAKSAMLPYLLWISYAIYLNAGLALRN